MFDPAYERERKFHLEKFLMRTKDKNEEEKKLIEEIRKLEAVRDYHIVLRLYNIYPTR